MLLFIFPLSSIHISWPPPNIGPWLIKCVVIFPYWPALTVNLSPYVNENINVYLLISYFQLFIFLSHATGVYPPIILPYYVLIIVNVLDLPWHIYQNLLTLKLCYDARYNIVNDLIYLVKNLEIYFYNFVCILDYVNLFFYFYSDFMIRIFFFTRLTFSYVYVIYETNFETVL